MDLGRVGIWSGELRGADPGEAAEAVAEAEELGYGTTWVPGGAGGDILDVVERLLVATRRSVIATGILNVWMHDPAEVAGRHHALSEAHGHRFMLGLGVSHSALVDRDEPGRYRKPLAVMADHLDALDAAEVPVPVAERCLAALGPKMLAMARDRSAGSHPYLSTPDHTAAARAVLGAGPLLMPELPVVLEEDPARARAVARTHLAVYLRLPNYTNNLLRSGFADADLTDGGSDRLVDGVIAWGGPDVVATRLQAHLDAGADHVCVHVLGSPTGVVPRSGWRALAGPLGLVPPGATTA